ncbi:hypothetical protein GCM10009092_43990 [Bowmanella denitrificans]|uniref:Lipoprotein n=1 Tax=Bowmanella denitrificans TaxID=366582 RepID=A0ABN0XWH5_9ALTE
MKRAPILLLSASIALLSSCKSDEPCLSHEQEIKTLKLQLELTNAKYESAMAKSAGERATYEYKVQLAQVDQLIAASQDALIKGLNQELDKRFNAYAEALKSKNEDAIKETKAKLDEAREEAARLKIELENQRNKTELAESYIENLPEVKSDVVDEVMKEVGVGNTAKDSDDSNDPAQHAAAMAALAAACTAASGGLCAVMAAQFASGLLGTETSVEDIKTAASVFESMSAGKPLTTEQKQFLDKRLGSSSSDIYKELVDIYTNRDRAGDYLKDKAKEALTKELGTDGVDLLEKLTRGESLSCQEIKNTLDLLPGNKRIATIEKTAKAIYRNYPEAAACMQSLSQAG